MSLLLVECDWSGGFTAYQAVIVLVDRQEHFGHVIPIDPKAVKSGCVPVMFDDEDGIFECFPADDISPRFEEALDSSG